MGAISRDGLVALVAGFVVGCGGSAPAWAGSYTFTELTVGGNAAVVAGINDSDQVVGSFSEPDGASHGFVWQNGSFKQVDYPYAVDFGFAGLTDDGLAGGEANGQSGPFAFVYNVATGGFVTLPQPSGYYVYAAGISDAGVVFGVAEPYRGNHPRGIIEPTSGSDPTLLRPGFYALGMNASGTVTGFLSRGLSYTVSNGKYKPVKAAGSAQTYARFIMDDGTVGGTYVSSAGVDVGFTYNAGKTLSFSYPGANWTEVVAIGRGGEVIGNWSSSASGLTHGFVYVAGAYYDIYSTVHDQTFISGGNGTGDLFGTFVDQQGTQAPISTGFIALCAAAQFPCTQ